MHCHLLKSIVLAGCILGLWISFFGNHCRAGNSFISAGGGISLFVPGLYSDAERFAASPNNYFFIEKPALLYLSGNSALVLTPGLSYIDNVQDQGTGTALVGVRTSKLVRSSFNSYLKINYQKKYLTREIVTLVFWDAGWNSGDYHDPGGEQPLDDEKQLVHFRKGDH